MRDHFRSHHGNAGRKADHNDMPRQAAHQAVADHTEDERVQPAAESSFEKRCRFSYFVLMMRSVKNRIRLGTSFLFLLVLLSGGFSIYYLTKVKQQSKNILRANYESLQGGIGMQSALDSIQYGKTVFI